MLRLGIDCGSLTVKGVVLDDSRTVVARENVLHNGEVLAAARKVLFALLDGRDRNVIEVALVGRHSGAIAAMLGLEPTDLVTAEMAGVRHAFGTVDNILHIGGGSLMLIKLDARGNLVAFSTNSVCAAGTGSFLDEQANRMGLSHDDANRIAPTMSPPSIATRCAVFAKTDLIHRQQEGFGREDLWCGLCKGMSHTALQTLLKGHDMEGSVALTGGVAANPGMVHYLCKAIGRDVRMSEDSPLAAAIGAALEGPFLPFVEVIRTLTSTGESTGPGEAIRTARPALRLDKSVFPDFAVARSYVDDQGNEVRLHQDDHLTGRLPVILGIDVGSTSTKAAVCHPDGRVLLDVYRRTEGDPVGASKKLLGAVRAAAAMFGLDLDVQAVGTTGSGRKIVGTIVGADGIVNEISAHVRGAVSVDPGVTTIFEIGGQDSKYMRVSNGRIADANMNYVCAAGTGTFVEELGRKLGFSLQEIGDAALDVAPPHTSDRCTVFMEQDAHNLEREGASRREVMAAILYSVIENYRTKVVGNRAVSKDKVVFQGATARNKGLVAAIEKVFDVQVVVSPYCHVMGAIGAGMLALDALRARECPTAFRGLDVADREVRVTTSNCELCSNRCLITTAHVENLDENPSFGYLCGREPHETRLRKNEEFGPFRTRKSALGIRRTKTPSGRPRIGVPMALTTYGYAPLYRTLIEQLGGEPVFSTETTRETADLGSRSVGSDFCFPVKVAHGHIAQLLDAGDLAGIFVPAMIEEKRNAHTTRNRFCPYVEAMGSLTQSTFGERSGATRLITPTIDMNLPVREIAAELVRGFEGVLDVTPRVCIRAWDAALEAQDAFFRAQEEAGRKVLADLAASGRKGIVIIGRPYNTQDAMVSSGIPAKISEHGFTVIPMDMLPFEPERLGPALDNMYWNYGQKILSAVRQVADNPNLYGVYLTSFNCGPDSFLLDMAETMMADKPFLVLELDEHGSDGGYLTRVEAFLDVLRAHGRNASHAVRMLEPPTGTREAMKGRILWIPRMHPVASRLIAAVFRGHGFESQCVPESDEEAHSLGKNACRGSECTPMALTLGTFLKTVRDSGLPSSRHAFFMPTATGPCRFGCYALSQHMAMQRVGMGDVPILSPTSENSYLGLPVAARKAVWETMLCGDYITKLAQKTRPYELEAGETNRMIEAWVVRLEQDFEARRDPRDTLAAAARALVRRPLRQERKPLVGVVGEIYVRSEPFSNAFVVDAIEKAGGEAWVSPIGEWILYTVWAQRKLGKARGETLFERFADEISNRFMERKDRVYHELMHPYLPDRLEPAVDEVIELGLPYIPKEFEGESVMTIGRALKFHQDGADLVVNAAPFGCMHGHISGALLDKYSRETGFPVVTNFYDGNPGNTNLKSFIMAAARRRGIGVGVEDLGGVG